MVAQFFAHFARTGIGVAGEKDKGQCIHHIAVEQDVQFHQVGFDVAFELIIETGISFGAGFQRVKEVIDDFVKRQFVMNIHPRRVEIFHVLEHATALLAQLHDAAHVVVGRVDVRLGNRLFGHGDGGGVGIVGGVIHHHHRAVLQRHAIDNAGRGGDKVEVILPLQAFLDNFHVQKPQKPAPEPKAQRDGGFRFKGEGRVVELQTLQRLAQVLVMGAVRREHAAIHHGVGFAIAGERRVGGTGGEGDGVAHAGVADGFDGGGQIANLSRAQFAAGL